MPLRLRFQASEFPDRRARYCGNESHPADLYEGPAEYVPALETAIRSDERAKAIGSHVRCAGCGLADFRAPRSRLPGRPDRVGDMNRRNELHRFGDPHQPAHVQGGRRRWHHHQNCKAGRKSSATGNVKAGSRGRVCG